MNRLLAKILLTSSVVLYCAGVVYSILIGFGVITLTNIRDVHRIGSFALVSIPMGVSIEMILFGSGDASRIFHFYTRGLLYMLPLILVFAIKPSIYELIASMVIFAALMLRIIWRLVTYGIPQRESRSVMNVDEVVESE